MCNQVKGTTHDVLLAQSYIRKRQINTIIIQTNGKCVGLSPHTPPSALFSDYITNLSDF